MSGNNREQGDIETDNGFGYVPADANLAIPVRRRATAIWGSAPDVTILAPGRIEIVGNHVDYNGGNVVSAAIDRWVAVAAQRRDDGMLTVAAPDVGRETMSEPLGSIRDAPDSPLADSPDWYALPRAAVAAALQGGMQLTSAALYYRGTIPLGLGLASSSALFVALVGALDRITASNSGRFRIAQIAQAGEHRLGIPVGLLDQVTSIVGGLLRFSNQREQIKRLTPPQGDTVFVVIDSGVPHSLRTSRYPTRVAECTRALQLLQHADYQINALADLAPSELEAAAAHLPAPLDQRLRHVVQEVERVKQAEAAIAASDLVELGRIMNSSGESSAALYDISHPKVEALVAAARRVPGVYGARMMGGGDGGAALVLIERSALPTLEQTITASPLAVCRIARGATAFN
ncbi:MAG: hypothetical protein M9890_04425 [Thermomicrobiales bacterium]|nr:hypothetical protein [Thermomicrobiales bacterium]